MSSGARAGEAPLGPRLSIGFGIGVIAIAAGYALLVAHYNFLGDDAFISFRYAANWAAGLGPVFNEGEPVEGYTNFLWVAMLAASMKLGAAPETTSRLLSIACGVAVLAVVAFESSRGGRFAGGARSAGLKLLAPAALALNRSFAGWSTSGLETMAFTLFVTAGLVRFSNERERGDEHPWGSALCLAAAALTRPEGALFAAVAGGVFVTRALASVAERKALLAWLACLVPLPLAHMAWRLHYYGDWVPNTFHAKVSGLWFEQGATYLGLFARDHVLLLLAPLVLLGCAPALRGERRLRTSLFVAAIVVYSVYVAAVGGDRFEFRFMVPVLALLALLLTEGVAELERWVRSRDLPDASTALVRSGAIIVVIGAMAVANFRGFPPEAGLASLETMAAYAERRSDEGRFLASLSAEGILPIDLTIAVTGAGALPYYSGLRTIDIHGLTEPEVARQRLHERGEIAHEKRASDAYLRRRGAVIVDVRNRIVDSADGRFSAHQVSIDNQLAKLAPTTGLEMRALRAQGRTMIFATTLADPEFRLRFARTEILH